MVVAFCGHADYVGCDEDQAKVLAALEKEVADASVEFYLGEYGGFDRFAYHCAKKFKERHPAARLVFVTPYMLTDQGRGAMVRERFDAILYPPLETVPPRFCISHRNRWIVEQSDLLVCYIRRSYGGAQAMYRYAVKKKKRIFLC